MPDILIDTAERVMTITFHRVDKKNSFTRTMYAEMAQALTQAQTDPAVNVVVFQGHESVFSSGNDIADFLQTPPTAQDAPVFQFMRAISTFTKLTEDYPELPEPYNNLAVLYAGQGQYDKARMALEMAIRTNPSYSTAHENIGDVYARLASQAYNKALQLDSSNMAVPPKLALIREVFKPNLANPRPTSGSTVVTAAAAPAVTSANTKPAAIPAPVAAPSAPAAVAAPAKPVIRLAGSGTIGWAYARM